MFVVYFRQCGWYKDIEVKGIYLTLEEAKKRLKTIMPNYEVLIPSLQVCDKTGVGWINSYDFGDIDISADNDTHRVFPI